MSTGKKTDPITKALYGDLENETPLETWLHEQARLCNLLQQEQAESVFMLSADPLDILIAIEEMEANGYSSTMNSYDNSQD